jgi:outer membrane protein
MSGRHQTLIVALLIASLALPAVPTFAQPAQQPAPPVQPPATPAAPSQPGAPSQPAAPAAPSYPPLPAVPTVPEVPYPPTTPGLPLTLADAITTALQGNFTVRLQAIQVALSQAQLRQAQGATLPTVSLTGGYTATSTSGTGTPLTGTISIPGAGIVNQPFVTGPIPVTGTPPWAFGLRLEYPLYTGNALQDQIAIAEANLANSEAGLAATAGQIVLSTRQAYYALQLARGQVAAEQRAVEASLVNVQVTQAQVRAGTAPEFDLLQAQTQLAQAQLALTQAKANAVQAQYNLNIVLNLPQTTIHTLTTALAMPAAPIDLAALVQTALRQRPELAQARASIQAAQASIDLAEAGLRPNVAITAGPNIQTSDPLHTDNVVWSGTIELTLAIFDGGVTAAKVQQAREQLAQAQTNELQLQQTIEQQVRAAYLGLERAAEELRANEAALTSAREQLRIANVRFRAGVGTQLDVVTALQSLAAADTGVVQAEYDYNVALAQLDQALGVEVRL